MARQSLTLARAKKLALEAIKDNDAHAEDLIELWLGTFENKADATKKAIRTEVLKTWYNHTDHYRQSFREFIRQFDGNEEGAEDGIESEAIESNAPAS